MDVRIEQTLWQGDHWSWMMSKHSAPSELRQGQVSVAIKHSELKARGRWIKGTPGAAAATHPQVHTDKAVRYGTH